MTARRRLGWLTLALGLALLLLVGRRSVGQPPLYDGVVVEDPYRYLDPASGGPGHPSSATGTLALDGGVSPAILAATQENPPQAELIIDRGSIALAAGTTSVTVTIEPIQPPGPAPSAAESTSIAGNVYRFALANQAGTQLLLQPGKTATVVLRAPNGVTTGTMARFVNGQWQLQTTVNGGLPDLYSTNATDLGTFAVMVNGAQASGSSLASPGSSLPATPSPTRPAAPAEGPSAAIWIAIGLLAVALLLGIWYLRDVARGPAPPPRR